MKVVRHEAVGMECFPPPASPPPESSYRHPQPVEGLIIVTIFGLKLAKRLAFYIDKERANIQVIGQHIVTVSTSSMCALWWEQMIFDEVVSALVCVVSLIKVVPKISSWDVLIYQSTLDLSSSEHVQVILSKIYV